MVVILLYREYFVQWNSCLFCLVLILLIGEGHFVLLDYLTTVFSNLVNYRVAASYLIMLFYVMKYWSHITVVKVTNRDIYDFFVWLSLDV